MASPTYVHEGFWINWTDGPVFGSTLTLSSRDGNLLVAFLALYVQIAGTHFWQIACWVFFQFRATRQSEGSSASIRQKHQAVLRNSNSAAGSVIDLSKIAWRSQHRASAAKHTLPPLLLALASMIGFLVAGIFSSRVTTTRSDVLLLPQACGYWPEDLNITDHQEWMANALEFSGQFVRNAADSLLLSEYCYGEQYSNSPRACSTPGRQFVNWTSRTADDCPFEDVPCSSSAHVVLDSGLVDSQVHLGINTPPSQRIAYRKHLVCSPLQVENYMRTYTWQNVSQLFNNSEVSPGNVFNLYEERLNWGNASHYQAYFLGKQTADTGYNATYIWNSAPDYALHSGTLAGNSPVYQLHVERHLPTGSKNESYRSTFEPLPGLHRTGSSTILVFMTNMASYIGPTHDPWFNATMSRVDNEADTGFNLTDYYNPMDNSVLGCFDHTELCNVVKPELPCVPLDMYGQSYLGNVSNILNLNAKQSTQATRLMNALVISPIAQIIGQLNGASMLAAKEAFDWSSPALPDNQWILELQNWFSASLILSQMNIRQYVTGYGREDYNRRNIPPAAEDAWMCHAQITQSTEYSSFSVFGLCFILIFGGLLVALDCALNTIADKVRARQKGDSPGHVRSQQWAEMELLDLLAKSERKRQGSTAPLLEPEKSSMHSSERSLSTSEPREKLLYRTTF